MKKARLRGLLRRVDSFTFDAFKYLTYAILAFDTILYSRYEVLAAPHLFRDGVALSEIIEAFPTAVDGWAWLILLLMFELETSVIPERKIRGALKWGLHAVRATCYTLGISALYGYLANLQLVYAFEPFAIDDVCALSRAGFSLMVDLPGYVLLDAANCGALANADLYRLVGHDIVAERESLSYVQRMAWADVINGVVWVLVVVVLEVDVWLEKRDLLAGRVAGVSNAVKGVLYGALLAAAVYWGFESSFIDFLDAALWLAAFAFIELNIFGSCPEAVRGPPTSP